MAKSENALIDTKTFFGFGKIQILLYPFDNIIKFSIANGTAAKPEYFNMTGISEIKLVMKNDKNQFEFPLFTESGDIDLTIGQIVFKMPLNRFNDVKKIYDSGVNLFYIVGTSQSTTSVIYTGLFKIYDNTTNVKALNDQANASVGNSSIILDPVQSKETATVTKRLVNEQAPVIKPGS